MSRGLRPLRNSKFEHYVPLPSVILSRNLEATQRLVAKLDPSKYAVVHAPELREEWQDLKLEGEKFEGYAIKSSRVQRAVAHQYYEDNGGAADTSAMVVNLEARVDAQAAQRAISMQQLQSVAQRMSYDHSEQDENEELRILIEDVSKTQFERPEYLIREAMQNAAGAADNPLENRIDVYFDANNRTVRVEDLGRGMSEQIMDDAFFNLYKSLNEALDSAAGKFGIGAVSFFGAGHDYVRVESAPLNGPALKTEVDEKLFRSEYEPSNRKQGTSVEIRFGEHADIDFDFMQRIIEEDCCYIETPIVVHRDGESKQINKELAPKSEKAIIGFDYRSVKGHVVKVEGEGELALLDHRIVLQRIPTRNYSGAVDCSGLETTLSRDSVVNDPVLSNTLSIVEQEARRLHQAGPGYQDLTLSQRLDQYWDYVNETLFADGTVNKDWVNKHVLNQKLPNANRWDNPTMLDRVVTAPYFLATLPFRKNKEKKTQEDYIDIINGMNVACIAGIFGVFAFDPFLSTHVFGGISLTGSSTVIYDRGIKPYAQQKFLGKISDLKGHTRSDDRTFTQRVTSSARKWARRAWQYVGMPATLMAAPLLAMYGVASLIDAPDRVVRTVNKGSDKVDGFVSRTFEAHPEIAYWVDYFLPERISPDMDVGFTSQMQTHVGASYSGNKLTAMRLSRIKRDNSGYVAEDVSNFLDIRPDEVLWTDASPSDLLFVLGDAPNLPSELEQLRTDSISSERKITALHTYMRDNFEYGGILDVSKAQQYNPLEGALRQRTLKCNNANTLAATWLQKLGVYNVRAVTGRLNNGPHMWLEVVQGTPEGDAWVLQDFTPSELNEDLEQLLKPPAQRFDFLPEMLFFGAAGLGAASLWKRRRRHLPYEGELSQEQEEYLRGLQHGGQDAYFGRLSVHESRFIAHGSVIVANPHRLDVDPLAIREAYQILNGDISALSGAEGVV